MTEQQDSNPIMPNSVRCHGGPLDGLLIQDRGPRLPSDGSLYVTRGSTVLWPTHQSGSYERQESGYHWRARE